MCSSGGRCMLLEQIGEAPSAQRLSPGVDEHLGRCDPTANGEPCAKGRGGGLPQGERPFPSPLAENTNAHRRDIADRRKAFIRKWRLRHKAVADSLEEAGDALFAFAALPPSQWKSARTTNAIERLHEEFKRRIKTQTVLPSADTAAMLFWALLASGQIVMRKIDGWNTLSTVSSDQQKLDAAA